jgi:hypothetical protein
MSQRKIYTVYLKWGPEENHDEETDIDGFGFYTQAELDAFMQGLNACLQNQEHEFVLVNM